MDIEIAQSIMTANPCYTAGKKITVKGLMLHSVGCAQPNASAFIKNWNKSTYNNACVHGFIDGNTGVIYQTLPWNHRGWHCGKGSKGSGNDTHIGVEMCEPSCIKYTSGATFTCYNKEEAITVSKRTYASAVKLFAYLCEMYSLDPMGDGVIISHAEGNARGIASSHADPSHMWTQLGMTGYSMDNFRKAVKEAIEADKKAQEEADKRAQEETKAEPKLDPIELTGKTDAEKIWNYLLSEICNKYGVAGLMGNLYAESALSSINLQDSYNSKLGMTDRQYTDAVDDGSYANFVKDSAGYGLAQWTYYTRKQKLYDFAQAHGTSIGDLGSQLGYLMKELKESYPSVLTTLKQAASVKVASDAVLLKFEKPANTGATVQEKRAAFGETFYKEYAEESSTSTTKPSTEAKKVNYYVRVGAYFFKFNATQIQKKLTKAGFSNTTIVQTSGRYRVQIGVYSNKNNATNMVTKLNKAGFKALIQEK